jgi:hypothetical protein
MDIWGARLPAVTVIVFMGALACGRTEDRRPMALPATSAPATLDAGPEGEARPMARFSVHLEVTSTDEHGAEARVTLRNAGPMPLERRDGHRGIRFDLIIELFDAEKRLLARCNTLQLFSPYSPDDDSVMRIPPGGSISDTVHLGMCLSEHGPLPPGTRFARVSFPFEEGRFTPSELVPMPIAVPAR